MQFDSATPIWVQLVSEFARRIAVGEWAAGSRIPGVRELALQLGVNSNTVQRSLAEMERRELCRSERTAGRFVTADETRIDALREELAREAATDFIHRVRGLRMHITQVQQLIQEAWDTHDDDTDKPREA